MPVYSSDAEYWARLNYHKSRLNSLKRNIYLLVHDSDSYIKQCFGILDDMLAEELVTPDWVDFQKARLIREMNSPNEFKEWAGKKISKLRGKS